MDDPVSNFLKRHLPAGLVRFIQGCGYRGYLAHSKFFFQQVKLEKEFRRNNFALAKTSFVLRKRFKFNIHSEARDAFEFFAFKDPAMVEEMDSFIKLTRKCKCLLDIGALYGIFSMVFSSRRSAKSYAFEPSQESFSILTEHAKLNPGSKIFPELSAVGEKKGMVEMFQRDIHLVCKGENEKGEAFRQFPLTSIDEFIREKGINPDTLKIDVEGFEEKVLLGGKNFLSQNDPLIFLELHPRFLVNQNSHHDAVISLLKSFGFNLFTSTLQPLKNNPIENQSQLVAFRVICAKADNLNDLALRYHGDC